MAVSKGVFIGLSLLVLVVGVAVGFLIGYFTHPRDCDVDGDTAHEPVHVYNHAPGPCKLVEGIELGSEDMAVLPSGVAIITAGMKSFLPRDRPDLLNRTGSLKLFDFNDPDSGAADIPIVNEDAFDYPHFNPHGISVWTDGSTDPAIVFVVNHNDVPDMMDTVERFEFDQSARQLTHIKTIVAVENMHFINNLIATSADTFYYTNFMASRDPAVYVPQLRAKVAAGSIGYYDGQKSHIYVSGLISPNGINISPDGNYVYLAVYGSDAFNTYSRAADNSLTLYKSYNVHTGPDNLDVDADGYVWIGCHPDHAKVMLYITDPNIVESASQALRLKVEDGILTESVEVYMDDGAFFSGCTVAVRYGEQLLMGSVFTNAVYCEAKYIG